MEKQNYKTTNLQPSKSQKHKITICLHHSSLFGIVMVGI